MVQKHENIYRKYIYMKIYIENTYTWAIHYVLKAKKTSMWSDKINVNETYMCYTISGILYIIIEEFVNQMCFRRKNELFLKIMDKIYIFTRTSQKKSLFLYINFIKKDFFLSSLKNLILKVFKKLKSKWRNLKNRGLETILKKERKT